MPNKSHLRMEDYRCCFSRVFFLNKFERRKMWVPVVLHTIILLLLRCMVDANLKLGENF